MCEAHGPTKNHQSPGGLLGAIIESSAGPFARTSSPKRRCANNVTERTHNFPFAEETSEENKIVINQLVDTSESRVSYRIDDI